MSSYLSSYFVSRSSWKYNTFSWSYLKTAFEKVEKNVSQKFAIYVIASVLEEANKSSLTLSVFHVTNMVKVSPTSSQFPHWLYETGCYPHFADGRTEAQWDEVACSRWCSRKWQSWDSRPPQTDPSPCSYSHATLPLARTFTKAALWGSA